MKLIELFEARDPELDQTDKNLYNYIHNETGWPGNMEELHRRYPLDKETFAFRGLNFSTKEDYEDFVEKIKSGPIEVGKSSWSPDKKTAETFAKFKQTYHVSAAVMDAHSEYEREREAIHGYKGVLLGMKITPEMKAVDVDKFAHSAESEILLPGGTYELKIIKEFSKFKDTIDLDKINQEFMNLNPGDRKYDYILAHHVDDLSPKARVKYLWDRLAGVMRMKKVYDSRDDAINSFAWKALTYFEKEKNVGLFPVDVLERALAGYFPKKYNDLILKLANKSADLFLKDYARDPKTVLHKHDLGRVKKLMTLVGRDDEFTQAQRAKFKSPYDDLQGNRVKEINKIRDPNERRKAMDSYIEDIKDLFGRI